MQKTYSYYNHQFFIIILRTIPTHTYQSKISTNKAMHKPNTYFPPNSIFPLSHPHSYTIMPSHLNHRTTSILLLSHTHPHTKLYRHHSTTNDNLHKISTSYIPNSTKYANQIYRLIICTIYINTRFILQSNSLNQFTTKLQKSKTPTHTKHPNI